MAYRNTWPVISAAEDITISTIACIIIYDKLLYLIMWHIKEHRDIAKQCLKLPQPIVKKYELWKNIVFRHGPKKLKEFSGFHDEMLQGKRKGQRSSRLSEQYRVIYTIEKDMVTVLVMEISPHKY